MEGDGGGRTEAEAPVSDNRRNFDLELGEDASHPDLARRTCCPNSPKLARRAACRRRSRSYGCYLGPPEAVKRQKPNGQPAGGLPTGLL